MDHAPKSKLNNKRIHRLDHRNFAVAVAAAAAATPHTHTHTVIQSQLMFGKKNMNICNSNLYFVVVFFFWNALICTCTQRQMDDEWIIKLHFLEILQSKNRDAVQFLSFISRFFACYLSVSVYPLCGAKHVNSLHISNNGTLNAKHDFGSFFFNFFFFSFIWILSIARVERFFRISHSILWIKIK